MSFVNVLNMDVFKLIAVCSRFKLLIDSDENNIVFILDVPN